jgi:DNA-binding CsgD family transcriptional regulator
LLEQQIGGAREDLRVLGLTAREIEVHNWLSEGKSTESIGIILGISRRAMEKHVESILAKLGVENRVEAGADGRFSGRDAIEFRVPGMSGEAAGFGPAVWTGEFAGEGETTACSGIRGRIHPAVGKLRMHRQCHQIHTMAMVTESCVLQGRRIEPAQFDQVRQLVATHPEWSRYRLSREALLQEAEVTVVGMPGSIGVVTESNQRPVVPPVFREWQAILEQWSRENIIELLTRSDEEARRLRQSSPFCGILTPEERLAIFSEYESL